MNRNNYQLSDLPSFFFSSSSPIINEIIIRVHHRTHRLQHLQYLSVFPYNKLRRLSKTKEREKEGAIEIEDNQRLVTQRLKCSELYCIWWQVEVGKKIEGDYHCLIICYISRGGGGSSVIVFIGDSSHPAREQCLNY